MERVGKTWELSVVLTNTWFAPAAVPGPESRCVVYALHNSRVCGALGDGGGGCELQGWLLLREGKTSL